MRFTFLLIVISIHLMAGAAAGELRLIDFWQDVSQVRRIFEGDPEMFSGEFALPLYGEQLNQFLSDQSRYETTEVGLVVKREICLIAVIIPTPPHCLSVYLGKGTQNADIRMLSESWAADIVRMRKVAKATQRAGVKLAPGQAEYFIFTLYALWLTADGEGNSFTGWKFVEDNRKFFTENFKLETSFDGRIALLSRLFKLDSEAAASKWSEFKKWMDFRR